MTGKSRKSPAQQQRGISSGASSTTQSVASSIDEMDPNIRLILNKIIEEKQSKYTEVLGVFVALFTFVSINIQIFSKVDSLGNAMIFVFFVFLGLMGFLFMMHLVINGEIKNNLILSLVVLFLATAIFWVGIWYIKRNDIPLSYQESKDITEIKSRLDYIDGRLEKRVR